MGSSGRITTVTIPSGSVTTTEIADGTIVNADVNPAAAIVASKLAAGGTANRVIATADGTTMALQQIVGTMIADNTIPSIKLTGGVPPPTNSIDNSHIIANAEIAVSKLDTGTTANRVVATTDGTTTVMTTVSSAMIADNTIVDADVFTGAGIVVTKLAHVGAGNVLKSTGTANVGGQVVNADVAAAAGITVSKLAAGGTANRVVLTSDGTTVTLGQVTGTMLGTDTITATQLAADSVGASELADDAVANANVVAGAAIVVSKLAAGGTANRVAATADGTTMAMQQVVGDMIADNTIAITKLNFDPTGGGGSIPADNSVTSAKIVDGSIMNADVNASAGIALSKLAAGTSGFVKSNGTVITAGNAFAATDIPADTITATQLGPDCVGASELADNAVADANVTAGAAIDVAKLANGTRGQVLMGGASVPGYAPIARKNLLVNGSMRICQRQALETAVTMIDNTQYTVDRWRSLFNGTAPLIYWTAGAYANPGSNARALKMTSKGGTTKFGAVQLLETLDVVHARTRSVSLQAKIYASAGISNVRMALLSWNGTADAVSADPISAWNADGTNPTLAAGWSYVNTPANLGVGAVTLTVQKIENMTVLADTNNLAVMIWCDDTAHTADVDQWIFNDVQLELGPVCTDVERLPLGTELSACQRFYEEIGSGVTNENFGAGLWITTTEAICNVTYKVRKRATPTVGVSANSDFFVYAGASNPACNGITTQAISVDFWGARPGVASGGGAVGQGTCFAAANANARIKLAAEL